MSNSNEMDEIRQNPPDWLIKTFEQHNLYKTLYDDLTANGAILQFKDRTTLAMLTVNILEAKTYREHVEEHGVMMVVNGDKGNPITRKNTNAELLDKKENRIIVLLKAFGAAPEYRSNIENKYTVETQPNSDGWDKI